MIEEVIKMFGEGMKKNLVLITKNFPYGYGETFIESEIEIAATKFDKITILVYQADLKKEKRSVPKNVHVIPLKTKSRVQKLFYYLFFLMNPFKLAEIIREVKKYDTFFEKRRCCSFYLECILKEYQAKRFLSDIFTKENDFIVYSYWLTDTAFLGYRLLRRFHLLGKKTFVSRAHGYDLYKERNQDVEFPYRAQIFGALTKIYPCSKQGENYLKQEYAFWKDKYSTKYLGTIGSNKPKCTINNNADRSFLVVTCSNIIPLKRLHRLAEALFEMEKKYPNIAKNMQWFCFGDGESEYKLKEYCRANLKYVKIHFKGRKTNKEIVDFYKSENVDIFVNVSETEGLPVAIMEAMAHHIPVIATDVGGTSEIVKNQENGILLEKNFENSQLIEALLEFINMPLLERKTFSEKAYNTWKSKFDCNINYNQFYDELKTIS